MSLVGLGDLVGPVGLVGLMALVGVVGPQGSGRAAAVAGPPGERIRTRPRRAICRSITVYFFRFSVGFSYTVIGRSDFQHHCIYFPWGFCIQ